MNTSVHGRRQLNDGGKWSANDGQDSGLRYVPLRQAKSHPAFGRRAWSSAVTCGWRCAERRKAGRLAAEADIVVLARSIVVSRIQEVHGFCIHAIVEALEAWFLTGRVMTTRPSSPADALDQLTGHTVSVVGDVMLDEYVMGSVERISPEAPVPVLRVGETELRVSGAANVARQIAALGGRVTLGGIVGTDAQGDDLLVLSQRAGVDTQAIVVAPTRQTTRKFRALSQGQPLLRLDWEETTIKSSRS